MIIVMGPEAQEEDIQRVSDKLKEWGYDSHISRGVERTLIGAVGAPEGEKEGIAEQLSRFPNVDRVVPILKPYKLVSRESQAQTTRVQVGEVEFGSSQIGVIAGPCAVESEEQILEAARAVKEAGACALRGGVYKPRTSPYSFQGLGEEGLKLMVAAREETGLPIVTEVMNLKLMVAAREETGLPIVTEVMNTQQIDLLEEADVLQVGARNMQHYDLLRAVGQTDKPVLLKRGFAATVQDWLRAAEYIAAAGNLRIIMCERGIRSFETQTRFTLDLGGMAAAQVETHLPVIADPSHSMGTHELVPQMALAAIAAGADGLLVEVHPHPDQALSDGPQSLTPARFQRLMSDLRKVAKAIGKEL